MWMTANSNEYNPNRPKEKNQVLLARAKRLLDDDNYEEFYLLLEECTNNKVDRDVEFRIMFDVLELLKLGIDNKTIAIIANYDICLEVDLHRISPIQACIARDLIEKYTPESFDFNDLLPESSFLKVRKSSMLKKTIEE